MLWNTVLTLTCYTLGAAQRAAPSAPSFDASSLQTPAALVQEDREARFFKFSTTESPKTAFLKRRIFNTSIALTVPMFSFILPSKAAPGEGSVTDLANQAIFGLFSLLAVTLVFAAPVMFNGLRSSSSSGRAYSSDAGILNSLMGGGSSITKGFSLGGGSGGGNRIGLDREKCLQNIICEAQRSPEKYGLAAVPFAIFFPPPTLETRRLNDLTPFQTAAWDGRYNAKEVNCRRKYSCFFDFLELFIYFTDMWNYSNETNDNINIFDN